LGHGGVWSDQDWPAVSKKNERDSTKEVVGSVSLLPALLCVDGEEEKKGKRYKRDIGVEGKRLHARTITTASEELSSQTRFQP
jgi:hypothetical protein